MKKYLSMIVCLIILITLCFIFTTKEKKNNNLETVKVAEVAHSVFYAPWYVAIEKGYFVDEGLNVEVILTPGADKVSAAILSNDVQIGFAGPESSIYVYKGGEKDYIKTFAGLTKRDGQFILSKEKIDNFDLTMLYGKEVLAGRKGGMPVLNFLNALKNNNIDPNKININYSIEFAALSGTFIGGMGDYVNLFEPTATKVVNQHYGYVVASIGQLSGEMPYTAFNARKSYIENNKETIQKFRNALNKGIEYTLNNDAKEVAKTIHPQFNDNNIEELTEMIKRYKDYDSWLSNTNITEDSFRNLEKIMIDNDLLNDYVNFKDLVINE